jgi:hypothetical protein
MPIIAGIIIRTNGFDNPPPRSTFSSGSPSGVVLLLLS